ncbi:MAG: Superoxide dismutase SodM-like protein, partial [uncultured Nocardioides sp.]
EVGDPRRNPHRPRLLRLAHPPVHRPRRRVRVRRGPRRRACRCDPVRHARRRIRPPRQRLHVRDHPAPPRPGRPGPLAHRRDRPRSRPRRRPLRRPGSPRPRRGPTRPVHDPGRRHRACSRRPGLRRPLRLLPAQPDPREGHPDM